MNSVRLLCLYDLLFKFDLLFKLDALMNYASVLTDWLYLIRLKWF